ncbi:ACP S-malonyltransferase [Paraburkholderia humisilvae]|uniref:[acyl-carrier-protein] S-malonyltransferase n=1 Tax=Paraburkholderia humisilvae TaxID=627669 RepID=A0A6J5EK11_9BURK|nr:ACP S-malonyltransferase [Paraburkholderia humisilvae]CAB3765791.1 hypothetical protein LMG29542_05232 [Paraburkholderia humisilvae]
MFPGQGSQIRGMGEPLFDRFSELVEQADQVLGYSIRELCVEDPRGELNRTEFTQPALFVVNALTNYAKLEDGEETPDFVAGHSLGELNALLAAGCFDFKTGVKLVKKRGELMSRAEKGAMAAIVNVSKEQIESTLVEHKLTQIGIANYNTPTQIVISGLADEIAKAEPLFKQGNTRFYPLNTSGAFHSRFMQPAMDAFAKFLKSFKFADPTIPVIANYTAQPYERRKIADNLAKQIANTVRWSESVQYLLALAKERGEDVTFAELGPGDVLTRLVETIRILTPGSSSPRSVSASARGPAGDGGMPDSADAASKVATWNSCFPVGTKVKSLVFDYHDLETRTAAMVLFGHRAAVYMNGYNGYFELDELVAI